MKAKKAREERRRTTRLEDRRRNQCTGREREKNLQKRKSRR
jgi:hypothetical protein